MHKNRDWVNMSRPGVKLTLGEGNEERVYKLQRSVQDAGSEEN
jgi:hypothetical protein